MAYKIVQLAYFGYSMINDVFGSNMLPSEYHKTASVPALQQFRDFVAASVVFPGGLFVSSTFWTLYAVDRELIFPVALDKFYPSWLNHMWHTNILLFVVIERTFIYHKYPRCFSGLSALLMFAIAYQLWMFWIAYHANLWVYPVFEVLSWMERLVFLVMCWLMMFGCYFTGELLTGFLWRAELDKVVATKAE